MTSNEKSNRNVTFSQDLKHEQRASQSHRDILSQPSQSMAQKDKLKWLQHRRSTGLWVQCDDCHKWRFMPDVLDRYELPNKWYCKNNPDPAFANCSVAATRIKICDEEDMIHSEYSAGSIVWARLQGWPWWPAMVDDCPDTEQYYWLDGLSDIPTWYNVSFFDKDVTRAWIRTENLKPFDSSKKSNIQMLCSNKKYKTRLQFAVNQAIDAYNLPLQARLNKYSFIDRYSGKIRLATLNGTLVKYYENKLKRKYNIAFEEDEDDETNERTESNVNEEPDSMAMQIGTPINNDASLQKESSNTYVPDSTAELVSLLEKTKSFEVVLESPKSGEFDF